MRRAALPPDILEVIKLVKPRSRTIREGYGLARMFYDSDEELRDAIDDFLCLADLQHKHD